MILNLPEKISLKMLAKGEGEQKREQNQIEKRERKNKRDLFHSLQKNKFELKHFKRYLLPHIL